jgi:PAS domain S-box-containing protein
MTQASARLKRKQKRAERQIINDTSQSQSELLLKLLSSLPNPLYIVNAADYTLSLSFPYDLYEKDDQESILFNVIFNKDKPCSESNTIRFLDQVIKFKRLVTIEQVYHSKTGKQIYEVHGYPILDEDGSVTHVAVYPFNITERKKTEASAAVNLAKYENIFNAVTDGLVVINFDKKILDANPQMCALFGYTYDEMITMRGSDLIPSSCRHDFSTIRSALETKEGFHVETTGLRKNGSTFDLEIFTAALLVMDNPLMMGICRDITERKEAESALKRDKEELLSQAKSLEETNTALKVLLKRRDDDRKEFEEMILINLKELVYPSIERLLTSPLSKAQKMGIEELFENLQNIVSPFLQNLKIQYHTLTPMEIKVANLIEAGKRSKEIADILCLSKRTIDAYRYNIRKKLKIADNIPLHAFFSNLNS